MSMINCPECHKKISSQASSCPHCGLNEPNVLIRNKRMKEIEDMQKVRCPYCNSRINRTANRCNTCDKEISSDQMEQISTKADKEFVARTVGWAVLILIVFTIFVIRVCRYDDSSRDSSKETVENSSWDGSVAQVKEWMQANLKDPDSVQYIEWSTVQKSYDGYRVRVKYRAKNSFGGYMVEQKIFKLDLLGNVEYQIDY